jgi:hypothetical protein
VRQASASEHSSEQQTDILPHSAPAVIRGARRRRPTPVGEPGIGRRATGKCAGWSFIW